MDKKKYTGRIRNKTILVFIVIFIGINCAVHLQTMNRINEEKLKATYTAEATVRRIEAQINKYLSKSDLLKQIIESGSTISDENFTELSGFMMADDDVIDVIELAKGGTVSSVYPLSGNEEAMGLDMFTDPDRKTSATIAKDSGEYTIAGPFQLVQGGEGALLFDPVYVKGENGQEEFWGFTILVIDWEKFIDEVELEEASYYYQVWKKNPVTGKKLTIAQCEKPVLDNALEVACEVPNDTWYFEICPKEGWYSKSQIWLNRLLGALLAVLIAILYWQRGMRSYKEARYAEEIKKSAEEAKAANTAKTGFLSRMSHDIRTPLNGIVGLLKIDAKHPEDREQVDKNREKMLIAANHLLALINDVLQMSKLESGEMVLAHDVVNLNELSQDILTIMEQRAAEAGVNIEYDRTSDKVEFPYVYASALHVRQLFLNVYGNCVKYNQIGGKVKIRLENLGLKDGIVTYRWIISDTGRGMSQEFLKHIFEPFAQEHTDARSVYNGTGLGMAIVNTLVHKMNGTIEVSSIEGKGSTFIITLPFEVTQEKKKVESLPAEETPSISGLNLLLAEDNELNAEIAEVLLKDEGAHITLVKDGQQAVGAFARSEPGTFDAILMDIMMPKIDGYTATRVIRSTNRQDAKAIPIIAMTAHVFDEDVKQCLEAGMNAHLPKPLQMEKVVSTIARLCKRK